jgi:hypothetical protein
MKNLTIDNKTKWNTKDLHKLIAHILKVKGYEMPYHNLTVHIEHHKRKRYWGQTFRHYHEIWMYVPKPEGTEHYLEAINNDGAHDHFIELTSTQYRQVKKHGREDTKTRLIKAPYSEIFDIKRFSQIFIHECGHARQGYKHEDMPWSSDIDVSFTEGFTVSKTIPKPKPKVDHKIKRYIHAKEMFTQHTKKLNRERNIVKKWKDKMKYYEKKYPSMVATLEEEND